MTSYLLFYQSDYDYTVHGIVRKNSATLKILEILNDLLWSLPLSKTRKLILHYGDLTDAGFVQNIIA